MKKLMSLLFALVAGFAVNAQQQETTEPSNNAAPVEQPAPAATEEPAAVEQPAASEQPAPAAVTEEPAAADQEGKSKIKPEELPQTVKKSLEGEEYRGWLINAAYQDSKTEQYSVELKNGAETKTVKFDKEGTKVD